MKNIPTYILILLVLSTPCFGDDGLTGVWQSSLELTKRYNDEHSKMTPEQAELLYQIVGYLKITYQSGTFVTESSDKSVTVKGETYPWHGDAGKYTYKVLGSDAESVVIQQFGDNLPGKITTIHFEGNDGYWEYIGSHSNINGREYFVRVKK